MIDTNEVQAMTDELMPQDEIETASPEEQRAAIEAALLERLGENWRRDWIVVHDANELVRLNKGDINLDFHADLLANVEIIEREASPIQLGGPMVAWLVLIASLAVALAIAAVAGVFN
jgi:hypothetical protein